MDAQLLQNTLLDVVQKSLAETKLPTSGESKAEAKPIVEYDGRMRTMGIERFGCPCYLSVVNLYLNQLDMDKHKAKGAFILYLERENASKFFKGFGIAFADDEDDASMMQACGQLAQKVALELKNDLMRQGYVELILSKSRNYKNNVNEGIEFSVDQKTKYESSFYYFKVMAVAADLTLAPIPKK